MSTPIVRIAWIHNLLSLNFACLVLCGIRIEADWTTWSHSDSLLFTQSLTPVTSVAEMRWLPTCMEFEAGATKCSCCSGVENWACSVCFGPWTRQFCCKYAVWTCVLLTFPPVSHLYSVPESRKELRPLLSLMWADVTPERCRPNSPVMHAAPEICLGAWAVPHWVGSTLGGPIIHIAEYYISDRGSKRCFRGRLYKQSMSWVIHSIISSLASTFSGLGKTDDTSLTVLFSKLLMDLSSINSSLLGI